jgi:hypothetical protein
MIKYVVVMDIKNIDTGKNLIGTYPIAGETPKEALEKTVDDFSKTTEKEEEYKLIDEFWGFNEMEFYSTASVCTAVERIYLNKERDIIKIRFTAQPIEF